MKGSTRKWKILPAQLPQLKNGIKNAFCFTITLQPKGGGVGAGKRFPSTSTSYFNSIFTQT